MNSSQGRRQSCLRFMQAAVLWLCTPQSHVGFTRSEMSATLHSGSSRGRASRLASGRVALCWRAISCSAQTQLQPPDNLCSAFPIDKRDEIHIKCLVVLPAMFTTWRYSCYHRLAAACAPGLYILVSTPSLW